MDEGDRIPLGPCDRHPSARAVTLWEHDAGTIALCRHCSSIHARALRAGGWNPAANDFHAWQTSPA